MSQPVKSRGIRLLLPVVLIVFLFAELVICPVFLDSAKRDFYYDMKYDLNPLEMKSVTVTNREDQKEVYDCYGEERLYRVEVLWENIGPYEGRYRQGLSFTAIGDEEYVLEVYPLRNYGLAREEAHMQMVPAQKSGCLVWYISASDSVDCIRISERGEKLNGEGKSAEVPLPEKPGETITVGM